MKNKYFFITTTIIFSLVAVLHLVRAARSWDLSVNTWSIPVEASWIAGIIAAYLAFSAYKLQRKSRQ
jgi:hypothetical protein